MVALCYLGHFKILRIIIIIIIIIKGVRPPNLASNIGHLLFYGHSPTQKLQQLETKRLLRSGFYPDDLVDELPVEKRHLSKLIIICRI